MFALARPAIAIALSLLTFCCASPKQTIPTPADTDTTGTIDIDSLTLQPHDELFAQMHTDILRAIDQRAEKGGENIRLIEAQSIVIIAEELYLEGNTYLAIKLLCEAELLLRLTP